MAQIVGYEPENGYQTMDTRKLYISFIFKAFSGLGRSRRVFFSPKKASLDFWEGSGVHLCHKIDVFSGNCLFLGNFLGSTFKADGVYIYIYK